MKLLVFKKGVYQIEYDGIKFDPPRTVLQLPAKAGDKWKRALQKDSDGVEGTATVVGAEQIETPAGTYEALRIDWEFTVEKGAIQRASFWYAPRVGLVKNLFKTTEYGDDQVVLQAFTPAK
jgi:hypothetical protein